MTRPIVMTWIRRALINVYKKIKETLLLSIRLSEELFLGVIAIRNISCMMGYVYGARGVNEEDVVGGNFV